MNPPIEAERGPSYNKKVAGSGRLAAAFDPTGARASVNKDLDSTVKGRAVFQQRGSGRFSNPWTLDVIVEGKVAGKDRQ